jgi:hypothetical protein
MSRLRRHSTLAATLTAQSDESLAALIRPATSLHSGVGGTSFRLTLEGESVFVKRVPLTDLERRPEAFCSTANHFDLPLYCQYGIGGPGFGAWRELAANIKATAWVLAGQCANFPLLFHWRVLPVPKPAPMTAPQRENVEREVQTWEGSSAVRKRLEAIHDASAHLVLFTEYVPQNLLEWTSAEFAKGAEASVAAVAFIEEHLTTTNDFMSAQGLTHFDTHFENIMTDGQRLYFSDFGLASATDFQLTDEERRFLARHRSYDHCRAAVGYLHAVSSAFLGAGDWKENLRTYIKSRQPPVPPAAQAVIAGWGPIGLAFLEFAHALREVSMLTAYPAETLERLLASRTSVR